MFNHPLAQMVLTFTLYTRFGLTENIVDGQECHLYVYFASDVFGWGHCPGKCRAADRKTGTNAAAGFAAKGQPASAGETGSRAF